MPDIFVAASKNKTKKPTKKGKREGMGTRYITVADRLVKQASGSKLRTFNLLPRKVKFETQEKKEKILVLLRQHWATQLSWMLMALLMVFLPLSLTVVPMVTFMPVNYQFMTVVMWYLLTLAYLYEKFITWFFHVFIITDERVIDVDFYNLLYKEVSDTKIDNIEDVTYRQGGVLRAMLNYGDVEIQTAGEKQEFKIESVPEPHKVAKILNELKLEEEHEKIMGRVR